MAAVRFLLCILAVLCGLFWAYLPSTQFGISFDDSWNLGGLASVVDAKTALEFVFGGNSGPLGRPISLATFLPSAHSWPLAPQDFILQNILLHLLNTTLVVWLAVRLAPYLPWRTHSPTGFALVAGAWWGSSPLLHSTSVMIIQRMTSLSATFCLAAMVLYVAGREALSRDRRGGLNLMTCAVSAGTCLSVLSKENGALLPGYILILEGLFLARAGCPPVAPPGTQSVFSRWRLLVLVLPVALLVGYLLVKLPSFAAAHSGRTFTLGERLMSEPRALFTYLRLFLFPVQSGLGPFHDDFRPSTGLLDSWSTLPAIFGVVLAVALACVLRTTRWWLGTFAVAWFLWGHILESTVVPLELYFEHRNYLPVLGIVLTLSALVFHPLFPGTLRWLLLTAVLGLNVFLLRESSLLWSEPRVAAAIWHERNPGSLRALQFHLIQVSEHGSVADYLSAVDAVGPPLSEGADYAVTRLAAYCGLREAPDVAAAAASAVAPLGTLRFGSVIPTMLDKLTDAVIEDQCPGLDADRLKVLLAAGLSNPTPVPLDSRAQLHEIRARLAIHLGDKALAVSDLDEALALRPTLSDAIALSGIFLSEGRYEEASRRLDLIEKSMPSRPFVRERWQRTIRESREIVMRSREGKD